MNNFLKELLEYQIKPDNLIKDHIQGEYVIKNVPCKDIEGIGIVYSSKTMAKIYGLMAYMKNEGLKKIEFNALEYGGN